MTAKQEEQSIPSSNLEQTPLRKPARKETKTYPALDALTSITALQTAAMSIPQIHSISMMDEMASALNASAHMKQLNSIQSLMPPELGVFTALDELTKTQQQLIDSQRWITDAFRNPIVELIARQESQIDALAKSLNAVATMPALSALRLEPPVIQSIYMPDNLFSVQPPSWMKMRDPILEAFDRQRKQIDSTKTAFDVSGIAMFLEAQSGTHKAIESLQSVMNLRNPLWEAFERERKQIEAMGWSVDASRLMPQLFELQNSTKGIESLMSSVVNLRDPMWKALEQERKQIESLTKAFDISTFFPKDLFGIDTHFSGLIGLDDNFERLGTDLITSFKRTTYDGISEIVIAPELVHFCSFHAFIGLGIQDLDGDITRAEDIVRNGDVSNSVQTLVLFIRRRFKQCVERHLTLDDTPASLLCGAHPIAASLIDALWQLSKELFDLSVTLDQLWSDLRSD